MNGIVESVKADALKYALTVLQGVLILVIGFYVAKKIKKLSKKILSKTAIEISFVSFISQMIYFGLLGVIIIASLEIIGFKTTSFVAILGAAGFAIGLAFKDSLSNFASGILILIFTPFRVHDFIEAAGTSGTVHEIQIFSTILKTPDNKTIMIPNSKIMSDNIINYTLQDKRRIDFLFSISYDSDIKLAKGIVEKVFLEDKAVLKEPKAIIGVQNLADSAIDLAARPWVNTEDYWDSYYRIIEKIKYEFDANHIEIPYPQRVIYYKNAPDNNEKA